MHKKQIKTNTSNVNGGLIVFFIIFLLILVTILIGALSNNIETSNKDKHEMKLIEEGKVETADTVINQIIEILKNRDKEKINQYLSNGFIYYDNDNIKSKFISEFWNDLKYYTGKHYIEQRGDTSNEEGKTFWIYWDIPEQIEYKQYADYSLQKICIYMKRVVKEDSITYEINQIILKNN